MWKASHTARKISSFSGLPFDELRSVALEIMVKLYDTWDPSKANFSTWLNRSLTFRVLNYLRDNSRMIKMPRTYADTYMKIRKIISFRPEVSDKELSETTKIDINLIRETRNAYQVTYQEINEDTEIPVEDKDREEDSLAKMLTDYKETLQKLADLPENEYNFLMDVYVNKRANSTIYRRNPGVNSAEKIKERTQEILSKVLTEPCQQDM
jgi:DNA-directed RNA polymerase specialized sigma24 family protein